METIIDILKDFGFPVAVCAAMFWFINKTIANLQENIKNTMVEFTKTINNNTNSLTALQTTVSNILTLVMKREGAQNDE